VARVPTLLRPDEVLLEYLVTSERVLIFVVTSGGVNIVESPADAATLAARVRTARELLARAADSERAWDVLQALHHELLEPASRYLSETVRHLVIVPHGPLGALPFSALRDGRRGRFVVQDRSVRYAPSAAAFAAIESRARSSRRPEQLTVLAPFPDRLPGSAAEAVAVGDAMADLRVDRVVGSGATPQRLLDALARPQLVHVATHATLSAGEPLRSRLELAGGALEVQEVLRHRVRAPWIFLSGCETGVPGTWETAFGRGDDVSTLAGAFNQAGVLGVVATLWRVPDRGAAVLASRYYVHLARTDAAEALARAQRDLLADPQLRAPYHWAAHVLVGARGLSAQSSPSAAVPPLYSVPTTNSRGGP